LDQKVAGIFSASRSKVAGKVTNIPVVAACFVLPSQIPPKLVLKPGLHLPVLFVVDWKALPSTDPVERLVLLELRLHLHSMNNDI